MKSEVFSLLRDWGDGILGCLAQDGALICPACGRAHGRSGEAAYPLLFLAHATGEEKYLLAAKRLFAWSESLCRPDGSMLNDPESAWKGTTVFGAISLHDALYYHGGLLSAAEREAWDRRLARMGRWLYENLVPGAPAYINYYAANACAMALLGRYFENAAYLARGRELCAYCLGLAGETGLLCGEGRPHDRRTLKGCGAVDIGYNAEESMPALLRCARALGDEILLAGAKGMATAILNYLLPDGAWDNSFGTRAFKWTYWGSRTACGAAGALFALGKEDPVFSEAARRHVKLLRRCTEQGLLYGGPGYAAAGEPPCVHHTFSHAGSLAAALENGIADVATCRLPAETLPAITRVPETDTYRCRVGDWLMDVTAYDFYAKAGAHVSGGCVSLLWHASLGPVLAAGPAADDLFEPLNQQRPFHPEAVRLAAPRVEAVIDGRAVGQQFDAAAGLTAEKTPEGVTVTAQFHLCAPDGAPVGGPCRMTCTLTPAGLLFTGSVPAETAKDAALVLPVTAPGAKTEVLKGAAAPPVSGFSLTPGFTFTEYRVWPAQDGTFAVRLSVF